MRSLKAFIEDCVFATPLNTVGMGNAYMDMDIASEPICGTGTKPQKKVNKKRKKMKSLKSYL